MSLSRFVTPFFDAGLGVRPPSGSKLFFFETGTSTPKDTFNCPDGTFANSNPVVANSSGVFPDIFFSGTFKVILKDKNDVQIWEADPVISFAQADTSTLKNFATLADAAADKTLQDGDAINIQERVAGEGGNGTWDVVLASTVTPNTYNIVVSTGDATLALVLSEPHLVDAASVNILTDNATDNTAAINAASTRQEQLTLQAGTTLADSIVPVDSFSVTGQGHKKTILKTNSASTNLVNFTGEDDVAFEDLEFLGLGKASGTTENGVVFNGATNARRNRFNNIRFNGFSGSGAQFSGGWGNEIDKGEFVNNTVGLDFKISAQLAGWSGSGFVLDSSYFASNDVGIRMQAIWNFTSINSVIENNTDPILQTASATPAVWINTWFEDNDNSPDLRQSNIFIGGRLEGGQNPVAGFYDNMTLPVAPFDHECITEITHGIQIFRDVTDQVFHADGLGVHAFKPAPDLGWDVLDSPVVGSTAKIIEVGRGTNAEGGGITSTTWGNDAAVPKDVNGLLAVRHLNSSDAALMTPAGFKVIGEGSTSGLGRGFIIARVSTGIYETGGAGATDEADRWEWSTVGHYSPFVDNTVDIGKSASFRVRDMRIVNAPIVGSDVRLKSDITSIPQPLLDFAMSTEIKQYKTKDGGRNHFGIVITDDFRASLEAVYAIDDCAAFCHDVFTDIDGNPITSEFRGAQLGDLWQVRYDEWQNIMLEAMRRKINAI